MLRRKTNAKGFVMEKLATQWLSVVATKRELNRHGPQEGVTLRYIFFIINKIVFFYLHRNNVIYYFGRFQDLAAAVILPGVAETILMYTD